RTGFPVMTIFAFGNQRSMPSYATQMRFTFLPSKRLVMPGNEFCSWMSVGIPRAAATCNKGPLAYPPTPITTCGLNWLISFRALNKLLMTFTGNKAFLTVSRRCKPLIQSPSILNPAAGTFSISIRPFAPTNKNSASASRLRKACAIAMAGKICPPVPPPLIMYLCDGIISLFSGFGFGFFRHIHRATHAEDHSEGKTGEPGRSSAHTHQWQWLTCDGNQLHGDGHIYQRLKYN